jgi:hypothetical protein
MTSGTGTFELVFAKRRGTASECLQNLGTAGVVNLAAIIRDRIFVWNEPVYLESQEIGFPYEPSEAYMTMLASESILGRDWESPEEEAAWADL